MVTLAALTALALPATTIETIATDDVWVYPHASSQDTDPFLRAWGLADADIESSEFSCSLLRFTLPENATGELTSAVLVLVGAPNATFSAKDSKDFPLEARRSEDGWTEKNWSFEKSGKFLPKSAKTEIFGSGSGDPSSNPEGYTIQIDLMKNKDLFAGELKKAMARPERTLSMALTSPMDPGSAEGMIYKVFSRNAAKKEQRPVLKLTFN